MSGGVDSAVAALLLKRAGFDVHGLYMSNWDDDDAYCTEAQDFQDARSSAAELCIPLHRVSFAEAYRARVFDYFLSEYRAGRTAREATRLASTVFNAVGVVASTTRPVSVPANSPPGITRDSRLALRVRCS